jgi:hypothetical protein
MLWSHRLHNHGSSTKIRLLSPQNSRIHRYIFIWRKKRRKKKEKKEKREKKKKKKKEEKEKDMVQAQRI